MIKLFWSFRTALAWVFSLVAFVAFAVGNSDFASAGNLYALMQSFSVLALVSCGLASVMIAGEFDLSIAGMLPLAALIAVKVGESVGVAVAIVVAVAASIVLGLLNGFLTARFSIPSLAVTVGSLVATIGVGYALAGDQVVTLTDFAPGLTLDQTIAGILSIRTIVQLVLALAAAFIMARTWLGLSTYATGSDRERAAASGLSVTSALLAGFVISAVFAGVAGALQGVSLASGQAGQNEAILLQAVTACIIGGISIAGGKGSLVGVIGGAFLLAVVGSGLSLGGTSTPVIQLINGAILLLVVVIDQPLGRRISRTLENSRVVADPTIDTAALTVKGSTR
jgi:ribose transport system permease protein